MGECGSLFQITVKPQRDLGGLLLPTASKCGCAPTLHNTYEIWIKVTLSGYIYIVSGCYFYKNRNYSIRPRLESLHSYYGIVHWKLSYDHLLHLTSYLNPPKNSANLCWMPKEWVETLETHSPLSFNDPNHWNTTSWHHLQTPEPENWWEIPSCHILTVLFFTVILFDDQTWRISIL